MRIALVAETFLPTVDGTVLTLCKLLEHLAAGGHTSLLFAPAGGPSVYSKTRVLGMSSYQLPLYSDIKLVPPLIDLSNEMAAFQPDVVHVINPVSLGVAAVRCAQSRRIPLVASFHTELADSARRWGLGILARPALSYLRWLHNKADLNLCPSHATRRELLANGFERVAVWKRGVDCQQFNPNKRTQEWRRRLTGGRPHKPLVLSVSRLCVEKRVDWCRSILDVASDARLAIVGEGPERAQLERLFAGTPTVFTGHLPGEDLAHAYAAADIFVSLGANETFGNVVLEAMASGLPVVAAAAGGQLDFVEHNDTGLFFPPEDRDVMITAVQSLISDPQSAARMGARGREIAEMWRWESTLDSLVAAYRRVTERTVDLTTPVELQMKHALAH